MRTKDLFSSNSFHSLIFLYSDEKENNIFWCVKDLNNKHNQPCAWGNIQMDFFLQTTELLNLLMKNLCLQMEYPNWSQTLFFFFW